LSLRRYFSLHIYAIKSLHSRKRNNPTKIILYFQFQTFCLLENFNLFGSTFIDGDVVSVKNCPKCNKSIPADSAFCPYCGTPLSTSINTHSYGWMIMAFLVSFLWFKINNNPIFPLGLIGALIIAFWSADIDKALGKEPLINYSIILAIIGMIIGFIVR
jgi:predicted nucleic acid-binding Zn ribbon protein